MIVLRQRRLGHGSMKASALACMLYTYVCAVPRFQSASQKLDVVTLHYILVQAIIESYNHVIKRLTKCKLKLFIFVSLTYYESTWIIVYRHIKAVSNLKFLNIITLRGFYFKIIFKVFRTCKVFWTCSKKKDTESDNITTQCKISKVIHVNLYSILHLYKCFWTAPNLKQQ